MKCSNVHLIAALAIGAIVAWGSIAPAIGARDVIGGCADCDESNFVQCKDIDNHCEKTDYIEICPKGGTTGCCSPEGTADWPCRNGKPECEYLDAETCLPLA